MRKNIALLLFAIVFLLAGCGKKVDNEALAHISEGLEKRWEYTSASDDEATIKSLEEAIQKELDALPKYDADDFKDVSLYILYDNHIRELEQGLHLLELATISNKEPGRDWNRNLEERSKILNELNSKYELSISDEHNDKFQDILKFTASSAGLGNDTEITETATMDYMEQITFRYYNSGELDNDSFEQKSELHACIAKVDSTTEKIKEKHPNEDPLAILIIELGKSVKSGCQDKLSGDHKSDYDNSYEIGKKIGFISGTYMNGELPPTVKFTIELNEAIKGTK